MKKVFLLLLAFALLMSIGFVVACGDDDDDDDDDDDVDVDKTACHAYHDECLPNEPDNFCAGYYDGQSQCMVDAADALFDCLGTDCDAELYTECTDQYVDDATDC